jgi:hypothetical protein
MESLRRILRAIDVHPVLLLPVVRADNRAEAGGSSEPHRPSDQNVRLLSIGQLTFWLAKVTCAPNGLCRAEAWIWVGSPAHARLMPSEIDCKV